jgi:hypothetical protein
MRGKYITDIIEINLIYNILVVNTYTVKKITKTCETYKCKLTVFENRVLRRIFGPQRDEVTGGL